VRAMGVLRGRVSGFNLPEIFPDSMETPEIHPNLHGICF